MRAAVRSRSVMESESAGAPPPPTGKCSVNADLKDGSAPHPSLLPSGEKGPGLLALEGEDCKPALSWSKGEGDRFDPSLEYAQSLETRGIGGQASYLAHAGTVEEALELSRLYMADLLEKGAAFNSPVTDEGFGLTTKFELPGGVEVILYEPRHPQP